MYKNEHLLDLTIANTSYLLNLDAHVQLGDVYQLELLESTDQFHNLDTFIPTGMSLTSVVNNTARVKNDE